jgi:hypothetical protein
VTVGRPVYADGRVHVVGDRCETCVFRPLNRMALSPGRLAGMIEATQATDGGHIICHSTLYGQADQEAVCRGWWDRYAAEHPTFRLAVALSVVAEVPPTASATLREEISRNP